MNTVINVDKHIAAIRNAIERGVYIIVEETLEGVEDDVFFLYRYRPLKPGGSLQSSDDLGSYILMDGYVTRHNKYNKYKLITYTVDGESMLIARIEPDGHQYFFYETEEAAIRQCVENNLAGWARANRFLTILTRVISAYGGDLKWHTNQP